MKKYKALYVAARNALSKIAGETLFLEKEPQSQESDEELLKALSAALNNRAGNGAVNPTETVKEGEVENGEADLFTLLNMERLKRLDAKIAARKKQENEEPPTDWQATTKQMQAYAATVVDLLDEMERKK